MKSIIGLKKVIGTNIALPVAAIATGPILARGLGVDDRGLLAAYTAVMMIAMYIASFGAQDAQSAFAARGHAELASLAAKRGQLTILAAGTFGVAAPLLILNEQPLAGIVCCSVPVLVYTQALRGHLQGSQRFGMLLAERWAGVIARLIALVVLLTLGALSVGSALIVHALSMALPLLLIVVLWKTRNHSKPLNEPESDSTQFSGPKTGYWKFSGQIWIGGLLTAVMLRADQLVLATFSTLRELGLYAVAVSIAEVLVLLSSAVKIALVPSAVALSVSEFGQIFRRAMILGAIATLVALPVSYFAIPLVFGNEFAGARIPALILIGSFLCILLLDLFDALLQSRGVSSGRMWSTVGAVVATIVLLPGFASTWGAIGAAVVSSIAYLVAAVSMVVVSWIKLGLERRSALEIFFGVREGREHRRVYRKRNRIRKVSARQPRAGRGGNRMNGSHSVQRSGKIPLTQSFGKYVTISLVLLPVSAALAIPRSVNLLSFVSVNTIILAAFAGAVLFLLALILTEVDKSQFKRDTKPLLLFLALVIWLSVSYAIGTNGTGGFNYILVGLVVTVIAKSVLDQDKILGFARTGFRMASLFSVAAYVYAPEWYVNKPEDFIDSGKIIASLPNVQGILGHPNYTGLFFATAITLEVSAIRFRNDRAARIAALFLVIEVSILVTSQARNAILAAALSCIVVLLVRKGRASVARCVSIATVMLASLPFLLSLYSVLSVTRPDFSSLSILGTRSSLWTAVCEALQYNLLFGAGGDFIILARSYVTDVDVVNVTHAHNQLLNALGEGGVVALILMVALMAQFYKRLIFANKQYSGIAGLVVIFSMSSLSETPVTPYLTQAGTVLIVLLVSSISVRAVVPLDNYSQRHLAVSPRAGTSSKRKLEAGGVR